MPTAKILSQPAPQPEPPPAPTTQEFCVATPLYKPFPLSLFKKSQLFSLYSESLTIDCFCVACNNASVLISQERQTEPSYNFNEDQARIYTREFVCTRTPSHRAFFTFRVHGEVLEKVGQSPSLADLVESEIRRYKPVLPNDQFRELSKAVGLASHGVGIGSYVYLRRIFEGLIVEAHGIASSSPGWDDQKFKESRMDEKIELLKNHLPPFLVEHRKLYGILSAGIHSLSEELCLEAFPVVKLGIELILEEKLAKKIQSEKSKLAAAQLQGIQQRIKTN